MLIKKSLVKILNPFKINTNCLNIHKKYIISKMEKYAPRKEQEDLDKLLTEMGIKDKNMPDIPHPEPRLTR
jgi:hypothetical protein